MPLTLDNYQLAHELFVSRLKEVQADLTCVFLFGSMARGEAIPGYSDLDYWIFLRDDVLEDWPRFCHILKLLVSASQQVQAAGIPVYNVCCYHFENRLEKLPIMLYANLGSEENSIVVLGEDIRQRMAPDADSRPTNQRASFYALRQQIYHPLAKFLGQNSFRDQERKQIFQGLQFAKYLPEAVCASLDLWPGERGARQAAAELFPEIDFGLLERVKQFCIDYQMEKALDEALAHELQKLLALVEEVQSALSPNELHHG